MFRKIFLQNGGQTNNYKRTILKGVDFSELLRNNIITLKEKEEILKIMDNEKLSFWGIKQNLSAEFDKINEGDIALIYFSGKKFKSMAKIVYKFEDKKFKLAEYLWGKDNCGKTWPNIYILDDLENIDIPSEDLFKIIGENRTFLQGSKCLEIEKSKKIIETYPIINEYLMKQK